VSVKVGYGAYTDKYVVSKGTDIFGSFKNINRMITSITMKW